MSVFSAAKTDKFSCTTYNAGPALVVSTMLNHHIASFFIVVRATEAILSTRWNDLKRDVSNDITCMESVYKNHTAVPSSGR
jgi:hypothetical protein